MAGIQMGNLGEASQNGNILMGCGCGGRRLNRVTKTLPESLTRPDELSLVMTSTPEPVYGCVTGTRYPFDEQQSLYVDVRDLKCLSEAYQPYE